eukprot:13830572-Alexandrium_andersonii.AAC.2
MVRDLHTIAIRITARLTTPINWSRVSRTMKRVGRAQISILEAVLTDRASVLETVTSSTLPYAPLVTVTASP